MKAILFGAVATLAVFGVVSRAYSATFGFEYSGGTYSTIPIPSSPPTPTFPSGIAPPGSTNTYLAAINDLGQIVGDYFTGACVGCAPEHGFLYIAGIYTNIDVPGASWGMPGSGTFPTAIDDTGQITGSFYTGSSCCSSTNPYVSGFLYSNGTYTTLQFPGSSYTTAQRMNASGEIIGQYADSNVGSYLYDNGTYTDMYPCSGIPDVANCAVVLTDINDAGQVFGYASYTLTPLPAALPLFATGLGALGLFGWRRKKKAALAA